MILRRECNLESRAMKSRIREPQLPIGALIRSQPVAPAAQTLKGYQDENENPTPRRFFPESVVQLSQAPGEVELVATKMADAIKSPADFKGHTLGVTGLGSSTNFLTQYMATAAGLKRSA